MGTIGDDFFRGTQGMRNATNAAAVSAISDTPLRDGELVYVATFRSYFALRKGSSATVDGVSVLSTLSGTGRWERLPIEHPSWLRQATWVIDPVSGNDENTGADLANAIKTDAERQRRWGLTAVFFASVTVTYVTLPPSTDVVSYDVRYAPGVLITIKGTVASSSKTDTITAVTTMDRANDVPWDITAATLGAADVGKVVLITSGARAGAYASILLDQGSGKVRVSPFGVMGTSIFTPWLATTPLVSDPIQVLDVPSLTIGTWRFMSMSNGASTSSANAVVIDSLKLVGGSSSQKSAIICDAGGVWFRATYLQNVVFSGAGSYGVAGGILNGVAVNVAHILGDPYMLFFACGNIGAFSVRYGAGAVLDADFICQNGAIVATGFIYGGNVAMFDKASGKALSVDINGAYVSRVNTSGDLLWGSGNVGQAVEVISGGKLAYVTKPRVNTLLGTGRQAIIGGTVKDWSAVPYVEPANNAMIVVRA